MIYCDLKRKNKNSAIYFFGTTTKDISGEIEIYKELKNPTVIKHPKTGEAPNSLLTKLVVKYKDKFSKGIFPDKVSFEC